MCGERERSEFLCCFDLKYFSFHNQIIKLCRNLTTQSHEYTHTNIHLCLSVSFSLFSLAWSDRKQEWGTDVRTPSTSGSGWIDNGGSSIQDSYQWGEEGEGWNSTATKGKV